jgi:hypothetical protein
MVTEDVLCCALYDALVSARIAPGFWMLFECSFLYSHVLANNLHLELLDKFVLVVCLWCLQDESCLPGELGLQVKAAAES